MNRRALSPATLRALVRVYRATAGAWFRDNRQAVLDLVVLLVLSGIAIGLAIALDATEAFFEFSRDHEAWQLDDVVLTSALVFSIGGLVFAVRRWTEAARSLAQANTDSLTEVLNHRRGWELLQLDAKRASRYGRALALIFLDLDHFKAVNDTHGHAAGDRVLMTVARELKRHVRGTDLLIRWGGEEFVVVCVETDLAQARQLTERLRAAVATAAVRGVVGVTASFGVAELGPGESAQVLLDRVDDRLYTAKSLGRNQVA